MYINMEVTAFSVSVQKGLRGCYDHARFFFVVVVALKVIKHNTPTYTKQNMNDNILMGDFSNYVLF